MKNMTYTEALKDAIRSEMLKDPNVFLAGEDISVMGGSFGVSAGLFDDLVRIRIVNTPDSETAHCWSGSWLRQQRECVRS